MATLCTSNARFSFSHRSSLLIYTKLPAAPKVACTMRSVTIQAKGLCENSHLVQSTKKWVDRVVIGEKLCPFAPPLIDSNTIRIVASSAQNSLEATKDIQTELDLLLRPSSYLTEISLSHTTVTTANLSNVHMTNVGSDVKAIPSHETTLVVFDGDFVRDFHEFVRMSWIFQSEAVVSGGYTADVQLVIFHPGAKHQTYGTSEMNGSAADFTIRSPYPLIHLLREVDVMRAVSGRYPNLEELPTRNRQKFLSQGIHLCKSRLLECYSPKVL